MMIDMDDPAALERRKLVNRASRRKRVRDSEPIDPRCCDAIIDAVCERGECDFVRDIAAPLPMILIGDMLGVAPEDRDDLLRWSDDMVERAERHRRPTSSSSRHDGRLRGYTAFCTRDDRAAPGASRPTTSMSVLVHAEVDGDRLDDDESCTSRCSSSSAATRRPAQYQRRHGAAAAPPRPAPACSSTTRTCFPSRSRRCCAGSSPIKNMCRTVTADTEFRGTAARTRARS